MIFKDRIDAGQQLVKKLAAYQNKKDTLVLALPRGGVPVAYEVAKALNLPLDVFLVRKLGVPGHEELAMGAIALGDIEVLNQDIIQSLNITRPMIDAAKSEEQKILMERNVRYRQNRPLPDLKNKTVILIDDGIATGATIKAAITAIKKLSCQAIVIATPVAPADTCEALAPLVNHIICLTTPDPFYAIGNYYEDFTQTTDEEVCRLLK